MGNRESGRNNEFHKMVQEMRKDQSRRVSINPEKVGLDPCRNIWPS
jgi:hypothetical protein